jgi:hypothetical protein
MIFKIKVWILKQEMKRIRRKNEKLLEKIMYIGDRINELNPIVEKADEYLKKDK